MATLPEPIQTLRDDFRQHLESFFAGLQLAPPYHSVEKTLLHFTNSLKNLSPGELDDLASNRARQWDLYQQAFQESHLYLKHRGIILGLIRANRTTHLSDPYQPFLDTYSSNKP